MGRGSPCRVRVASGGSRRKASSMTTRARCHNRKTRSAAGKRWRRLRSLPAFRLPDQRVGIRSDFRCRHRSLPIRNAQRGIGRTFNWGSLQASERDALQREPRKCCGNAHMRDEYHRENRLCEHFTSLPDYWQRAGRADPRHDLILLRLLLRGDRNDEVVCYPLFGLDALDNESTQRPERLPRLPDHQTILCQSDGGWPSAVALELGTAKRISSVTVERIGAAPPSRAAPRKSASGAGGRTPLDLFARRQRASPIEVMK